jgi:hypothetical protein
VEGVVSAVVDSNKDHEEQRPPTLRNSFVASCHSLVMVLGGGLANERMVAKRRMLAATPMAV